MTSLPIPAAQLRHQAHTHHTPGHSAPAPVQPESTPAAPLTGIFAGSGGQNENFGIALGAAVAAGASAPVPTLFAKATAVRDTNAAATAATAAANGAAATGSAPAVPLVPPPVAKFTAASVATPAPTAGNSEANWAAPSAANASTVNVGLARSADPRDAAVLLANLNGDQTAVNQMHNFYDVGGQGYKPWLNQLVTLGLDAPLPGAMAQQWASEGLGTVAADGRWTWADGKGW